jgi:hypothetical protein
MDRPIDTAAPEQRLVRRIYDRIDLQRGDVGFDDLESGHSWPPASS